MTKFTITKMTIAKEVQPNGVTTLARFDYDDGLYLMPDCALIQFENGNISAALPSIFIREGFQRVSLRMSNRDAHQRLICAAKRKFVEVGGNPAWMQQPSRGETVEEARTKFVRDEQALADLLPPPINRAPAEAEPGPKESIE